MTPPKTVLHLLSGGLDSVTMLRHLKDQGCLVHCLLFDYKQQHVQELQFAKLACHRENVLFTTLQLPELGGLNEQSWIVPNRNAIMLSIAINVAVKIGAQTITIGCNADDESYFPDCRVGFLDAMNQAVKAAGYDIEICAPFLKLSKWQIGAIAKEIGIKSSDVWTCYKGGKEPCGTCPACLKLKEAFA